jgi:uncharacterized protein
MKRSMTNLEVVRDLYRAMRERDDAAVHVLCAADVVWVQSPGFPGGGTWHGPQEVIERVFRANAERWAGFAFTAEEFLEADGRVVVLGAYSGRAATTGKEMRAIVAHVYDVVGGRVVRFRMFADTQQMWLALG